MNDKRYSMAWLQGIWERLAPRQSGPPTAREVEKMLPVFRSFDTDQEARQRLHALARTGRGLNAICEYLFSPVRGHRYTALKVLDEAVPQWFLEGRLSWITERVQQLWASQNNQERRIALEALGAVRSNTLELIILDALSDKDLWIRHGALSAVSKALEFRPDASEAIVRAVLATDEARKRENEVSEVMGRIGADNETALTYVLECLDPSNIIDAAGSLQNIGALKALTEIAKKGIVFEGGSKRISAAVDAFVDNLLSQVGDWNDEDRWEDEKRFLCRALAVGTRADGIELLLMIARDPFRAQEACAVISDLLQRDSLSLDKRTLVGLKDVPDLSAKTWRPLASNKKHEWYEGTIAMSGVRNSARRRLRQFGRP